VDSKRVIRVAAAVIPSGGRYLMTRRAAGSHMAGHWEFPGGKIEPGETPGQALVRELHEELGVQVETAEPVDILRHQYRDRHVELHFIAAELREGEPRALQVDDFGWFTPEEMPDLPVLEADLPLVERLARRQPAPEGENT
jgi:8-oxo-dGTP diphosphatase